MNIKTLSLTNFRNYKSGDFIFSPTLNVLVGDNAQGKTNVIEAIYLSSIGKGSRAKKEKELIMFEKDFCKTNLVVKKEFGDINIKINIDSKNKKSVCVNGAYLQKIGSLIGTLTTIFFSPQELKLIKDAPSDRRKFLDVDISQIDKEYFHTLVRYNRTLAQRNALLKKGEKIAKEAINIWNKELSVLGAKIIFKRQNFLNTILPLVTNQHQFLSSKKEQIDLKYVCVNFDTEKEIGSTIEQQIEKDMLTMLESSLEKDLKLKFTSIGPHRDDIKISINNLDIRSFGSQGQQRTAALSIKLAEMQLFKNITGEWPVLLLDDVFSELDASRQKKLLEAVKDFQTIITATEFEQSPEVKIFNIKNGTVK